MSRVENNEEEELGKIEDDSKNNILPPPHHQHHHADSTTKATSVVLNSIKQLIKKSNNKSQLDFQHQLHALLPTIINNQNTQAKLDHLEEAINKSRKALSHAPITFNTFICNLFNCKNWQIDEKRVIARQLVFEDFIVLLLLMTVQLLITPARTQLNNLAGLMITSDPLLQYSIEKHAQILFIGSIVALFAKLSTGFIIDVMDPLIIYSILTFTAAVCVLLMSELHNITDNTNSSQQFASLATLYAIDAFCQIGMLACGIKYIHDHFRPAQWGRCVTIYVIGGRLGSIVSICICGAIISSGTTNWEDGTRTAAIMCFCALIPLGILKIFLPHPATHLAAIHENDFIKKRDRHDAPALPANRIRIGFASCQSKERRKQDLDHFLLGLKRFFSWWQRRSFILMAIATASMAVIVSPEGFDGFISLFTRRALRTPGGLPVGSVTVLYHLGAIVSLLIGGTYIERLSSASQTRAVILLLMLGCLAVAMLIPLAATGAVLSMDSLFLADGGRTVLFFIGFGFGYPFFVTVPTFAMNFGGEHSALAVQALTMFQLGLCSVFVSLVGIFANQSWMIVSAILFGFAILSLLFMMLFHFFEWRRKQQLAHQRVQKALNQLLESNDLIEEGVREVNDEDNTRVSRREDSSHQNVSKIRSIFATCMFLSLIIGMFVSNYYSQLADQYASSAEV